MGNPATKIIALVTTILLVLILFRENPSWAKGPLDSEASYFIKYTLSPILIREKLCNSIQDCIERDYFLYTSWNTISCDLYGITDEKIIKEIFLAMLSRGLRVSHFCVWRNTNHDKSFFEKPILEFTDHTGDK